MLLYNENADINDLSDKDSASALHSENNNDSLDSDVVERAVAEFSQLQFNSERCFHLMTINEKQVSLKVNYLSTKLKSYKVNYLSTKLF